VLVHAARALEPDFDLQTETIPLGDIKLPNPIIAYDELLDRHINGSLSKIHGDLHLGNVLIGPNHSACLIDFAHTRDGHTLFDWATLETSLLSDMVMPAVGTSWDDTRRALEAIANLNASAPVHETDPGIARLLEPVVAVREIVKDCLAEGNWDEYFIPLALCALRATTWETIPVASRRLMFLVAALAMHELRHRLRGKGADETPFPDESDITDSS
jgi:hypothetical protein